MRRMRAMRSRTCSGIGRADLAMRWNADSVPAIFYTLKGYPVHAMPSGRGDPGPPNL